MWRRLKQTIQQWSIQRKIQWRIVTIAACSTTGVVLVLTLLGTFQFLEWVLLDQWFRLRPLEEKDSRIVIVSITEQDILRLNQWPMSDDVLANLIEAIASHNPRVIGLDLYRDLPVEPGHQRLLEVMRSTPQLIGIEKSVGDPVAPPPELARQNNVGAADLIVDADGTIRRGLLSLNRAGQSVLSSFGTKIALAYLEADGVSLQPIPDRPQHFQLGQTRFRRWEPDDGGYVGEKTGGYQVLLNFRRSHCHPSDASTSCSISVLSMEDVLNNHHSLAESLADRIVLIGVMAASARDVFYTPYSYDDTTIMAGVEIHAQLISQILSAALDGRSLIQSWPQWLEYLWIGVWAGLGTVSVALSLCHKRLTLGLLFVGGSWSLLLVSLTLGSYLAFLGHWWIPAVSPILALSGSTILSTTAILWSKLRYSYRQLEHTNSQLAQANSQLVQTNGQLEQVNSQLAAYSQTLEEKVAERTAELLVAKEAADNANRAKSEFLANMSHELRTPLNGVLGYAQLMESSPTLPEQERHRVSVIYQCGSHLLTLINDVLDLAKIEARKLELFPETLLLASFLHSVVELCVIRAQQKGIEFQFQFSPRLPQSVITDVTRLRQVLINLINNAIKFTDVGSVTLSVEVLKQSGTQVSLFFQVVDTGVGIAEADLAKLFGAFEQVGDRTKKAEGSGLGLAISQRIITLMGGTICVRSQLRQGSEFYFILDVPLSPETQPSGRERRIIGYRVMGATPVSNAPYCILIIDDRWENREVLLNLLEPVGLKVLIARDGLDGLHLLSTQSPDVVILDLMLPTMDGFDILECIHHSDSFEDYKVIVSSVVATSAIRERVISHGGDYFLPRPVDAELLFSILSECLVLEWIYDLTESSSQSLDRQSSNRQFPSPSASNPQPVASPAIPPVQNLKGLLSLVERHHINALLLQLEQLTLMDENYHEFTDSVAQLARQLKTEDIEQLLKRYIAQG